MATNTDNIMFEMQVRNFIPVVRLTKKAVFKIVIMTELLELQVFTTFHHRPLQKLISFLK